MIQANRWRAAATALGIAIVLVAALLLAVNDDDSGTEVATDGTTTSIDETTTSTTEPEPTTTSSTAAAPSTTQKKPTTTRPASVAAAPERRCVTTPAGAPVPPSDDWAEHYETKPEPNDGLTFTLCIDDVTPAVGQTVVATVTADDPDALIGAGMCDIDVHWEPTGDLCRDVVIAENGTKPTPAEQHGHREMRYEHVYGNAGERTVAGRAWSGPGDGRRHPYESYNRAELKVTVHPR